VAHPGLNFAVTVGQCHHTLQLLTQASLKAMQVGPPPPVTNYPVEVIKLGAVAMTMMLMMMPLVEVEGG
jgi:hypothetical protein